MNYDESLYREALKREGLDENAPGLIDALRRTHEEALTSGLVMRAFSGWRRAREAAAHKPANLHPKIRGAETRC